MKKIAVTFLIVIMVLFITISCKKKDDPGNQVTPMEKKKYAWACGFPDSTGYGIILFSADGGDTWGRQGEGLLALQGIRVNDIWASDENNVWAIGSKNTILRTINGGMTWTLLQAPVNTVNPMLNAISIVNKTNIWISGSNGRIYNSANNGGNWTMFDTTFFHNCNLQGILAFSPTKVYVCGNNSSSGKGVIGYTLDGGATWDSIVFSNDYNKHKWIGICSAGNTVVVYGEKAHYVVSTNGGTTWINDSVPNTGGIGGADINHLIMLNSQTWWGAFDMGQIFITFNGGANWIEQKTGQGGFYLVGIDAWDSKLAIVVGFPEGSSTNCPIIKTSNAGALWEKKYTTRHSALWKVTFIKN